MAKTSILMNFTGVTITPSGGSAIAIAEVTDIDLGREVQQEHFYGDNRRFARLIRNVMKKRKVAIHTADATLAATVPEDTACTVVAILNDAVNGTGAGAVTFTLANCVLKSNPYKGQNNKFAEVTLDFDCFGDASDTDPLSYAVAP